MNIETFTKHSGEFSEKFDHYDQEKYPEFGNFTFEVHKDKFVEYDDDGGYYWGASFKLISMYGEDDEGNEFLLNADALEADFIEMVEGELGDLMYREGNEYREHLRPLEAMIKMSSWDVDMLAMEMLTNGGTIDEIAEKIQSRAGPSKARQFLKEHGDGVRIRDWVKREYSGTERAKVLALLKKKN